MTEFRASARRRSPLPAALGAALLAPLLPAAVARAGPAPAQAGFDPAVALVRAADASGDGEVTGEEWVAFLEGLGADADGVVDRYRVKAIVVGLAGGLTRSEVEAALGPRREGARGSGGFLGALVRDLADQDGDGRVSDGERRRFLEEACPEGADVTPEGVADWLRRAEQIPPSEDRNAVNPGVFLVGLDPLLDADANGRITLTDLNALHRGLDASGDGRIDATELSAPPTNGGGAASGERWAVTEEARRRPPLMPWQRNLEDALAISRETGKPLLICVNMDGENASEALAWGRYRDPEFVALAEGFVPLIVSPDRREPRERDDRGRRLPDRRFGRVVNSEHIDIEPEVYERYFGGTRVAPRHVGVAPDGEVLFDVYLVQDLSIVDAKLREFGVETPPRPAPSTRTEAELLASPWAADRDELEGRFVAADERGRVRLAGLALSAVRATQHPELVRLALRDPAPAVRLEGVWTMVRHPEAMPLDAVPEAAAVVADDEQTRALLASATRRAETAAAAAGDGKRRDNADFHARVLEAAGRRSAAVDPRAWRLAIGLARPSAAPVPGEADLDPTAALLEELEAELGRTPEDPTLWTLLAGARLRFARILIATGGGNPGFFFEDARVAADRALALAPDDARALGYRAWASWMVSEPEAAGESAARALPGLVRDAGTPLAYEVLGVFANVRTRTVYEAIAAGEAWPEGTAADALAAHEVLVAHPASTAQHWTAYLSLLESLRLHTRQADVVRRGLERFPTSSDLHAWLRAQVLRDAGARALEAAYAEPPLSRLAREHGPTIDWFHGLATFMAAERDVADRRLETAWSTYRRSRERFARSVEQAPDFAPSAVHYQALAHAGEARLLADAGRLADAVRAIVESARTAPGSFELEDGLGNSPDETARDLRRRLRRAGDADLARELEEGLAEAGVR